MATQAQIDKLLAYDGFDGYARSDEAENIEDLLYEADAQEVQTSFHEGSRWSNYTETIHKVVAEPSGEELFFRTYEERPTTEMQDGGDFTLEFSKVFKKEKVITAYE